MDERNENTPQPENEGYTPRPAWQVWAARIGLVIFLGFVVFQLISVARGGL